MTAGLGTGIVRACGVGLVTLALLMLARPVAAQTAALTPDEALARMQAGNQRFMAGTAQHPHADRGRLEETAGGQAPFATVIGCSDSRVPIEVVFDQGIGDLFVIRVAGNVCDVDEIGSIEYGVDHLATPLLVVLGHENCGAVTAVATGAEVHGSIPALIDNIRPAVERAEALTGAEGSEVVSAAVVENVWQSISDLISNSPPVRQRLNAGQLKIVGAVYSLESGEVRWLGEHPRQASLLATPVPTPPHSSDPAVEADHEAEEGEAALSERAALDSARLDRLAAANRWLSNMMMILTGGLALIMLGLVALAYRVFRGRAG